MIIDCVVYLEQPEGFEKVGKNGEKLVCKLRKSLYGLKQSGRNWNNLLHSYLLQEGFTQSQVDYCVYTRFMQNEKVVMVVWVDDMMVAACSIRTLTSTKKILCNRFRMKDLGKLHNFLGIEFVHEVDCIRMNQSKFLCKILEKYGMANSKPRSTPYEPDVCKTCDSDSNCEPVDAKLYRGIVGSLIYAMTATRPDLSFIVTKLSQYMANPNSNHLTAAKHVLRYIKGTVEFGLCYRKVNSSLKLLAYCDADWGASVTDRRSITGFAFQLSNDSSLISWKSTKQKTVALSTCEAEYMSLSAATQEAKFLLQLLNSFKLGGPFNSVLMHVDNQGALALAKNPVQHQRSKHIDIRYHFVRLDVQKGLVQLTYVPSDSNIADVFTKTLGKAKLMNFVKTIGLSPKS